MDAETRDSIKSVYNRIDDVDTKYDQKNEKLIGKCDDINSDLTKLFGPMASMTAKVENNSKMIWWMVGLTATSVLSAFGTLVMFVLERISD